MKVVFAHTDFRIYWYSRLLALAQFLEEKNIELEIVEIAGAGSPYFFVKNDVTKPSNRHCLFPDQKMEDLSFSKANHLLRRKLDEIRPDIVFAGAIAFPSGAAAVRWAVDNRSKVVIFDDSRLIDTPRSSFVNFMKRSIYESVDAVFCPSPAWIETYNFYGIRKAQIFFGVDVVDNRFWQKQVISQNIDLPDGYFLTVGRQVQKKNLMCLLQAYLHYTRQTTNPKDLVLVGEGPLHSGIEQFAVQNQLKTVHFLPFVSQDELKGIYNKASFFILPSLLGETWGLTVNEAMASGLPVLVSNEVGCTSTLVKEGINGFIFSPLSPDGLTELLVKAGEIPDNVAKEMGRRSEEIISEWDLDRFCSGVYDAINYVSIQKNKKPALISRLIIRFWKGRYRTF